MMRRVAIMTVFAIATSTDNNEDSLESLGIFVDDSAKVEKTVIQPTEYRSDFSPLYELSDTNFSDFVSSSPLVLVEL